jgi:hypothetical protein
VAATARNLLARRPLFLALLGTTGKLLAVERRFPRVDGTTERAARAALAEQLEREVAAQDGLAAILAPAAIDADLPAAFATHIRRPEVRRGTGPLGRPYAFSDAEIEQMIEVVAGLAARLPEALLLEELRALGTLRTPTGAPLLFADQPLVDELAGVLAGRQREVLLAATEERDPAELVLGDGTLQPAQLTRFRHPLEARTLAARLLANGRAESLVWGVREREAVADAFFQLLGAVHPTLHRLPLHRQGAAVARWIVDNTALFAELHGPADEAHPITAARPNTPPAR